MTETKDSANAIVRPPIVLLLVIAAGLALHWFYPLRWLPANMPSGWIGAAIFALGLALFIWAIVTFRSAGTPVQGSQPTTAIVTGGPYGFSRNPIYLAMFTGLAGIAVGFDTLWVLAGLIAFYFVLRYGVVAREEAYLERKFGSVYLDYKSRVRRWL
ncbi:MAG: isoprenylcysteine carboxylmethyltransferase family protein [Bradyrhizobiaceae bacterium]|nr:isoprenylcysteine carboxylmethyltransferase family protein [Bradyrhizobiaceae bacterium]